MEVFYFRKMKSTADANVILRRDAILKIVIYLSVYCFYLGLFFLLRYIMASIRKELGFSAYYLLLKEFNF